MNKSWYAVLLVAVGFLILVLLGSRYFSGDNSRFDLDSFAKCIAGKNIAMYGAEWCPHCQNEKYRFGEAFEFIPYIECPDEPQKCIAAGVTAYPTWIFGDGRKIEGDMPLEMLSKESGCPLTTRS